MTGYLAGPLPPVPARRPGHHQPVVAGQPQAGVPPDQQPPHRHHPAPVLRRRVYISEVANLSLRALRLKYKLHRMKDAARLRNNIT